MEKKEGNKERRKEGRKGGRKEGSDTENNKRNFLIVSDKRVLFF